MKKDNVIDYLLYRPMERFGEEYIISIYRGEGYSYGYYAHLVDRLSCDFQNIGIGKEAVIVFIEDCPACIACFLSLINIGAKPLLVSTKTLPDVLSKILSISKARMILCDEVTKELVAEKEYVRHISNHNSCLCDTDLLSGAPSLINDGVAYLALTSGSSGIPKIVMHSSSEMLSAINLYAVKTLQITSADVLFSIPKICFTYGLANSLFFSFFTGAKAILYQGSLGNKEIVNLVKQNKVTFFFAVPTLYERIGKDKEVNFYDLKTICQYISAGEHLSCDLVNKWYKFTYKYIIDSVGCSETGSAYLVNFNSKNKAGSAGLPVDGYTLSLISGDNSHGMLVVEGPSNAMGYLNDCYETSHKFVCKTIHTGDWFYKDEDGYYWFLGRNDDMIKRNGRWVSLNQISDQAKKFMHVKNATAFVLKNQIYLVVDIDIASNEFNLFAFEHTLIDSLEHYKKPDKIFIDSIPINTNGKIDSKELRARYELQ